MHAAREPHMPARVDIHTAALLTFQKEEVEAGQYTRLHTSAEPPTPARAYEIGWGPFNPKLYEKTLTNDEDRTNYTAALLMFWEEKVESEKYIRIRLHTSAHIHQCTPPPV